MTSTKYFLWECYLDGKCAGFFIHHRSKWKIGILALISFCALLKVVFVTLNITWLLTKILPNHELQLGHSMIEPFIISSSVWCWMVWKVKKNMWIRIWDAFLLGTELCSSKIHMLKLQAQLWCYERCSLWGMTKLDGIGALKEESLEILLSLFLPVRRLCRWPSASQEESAH